ncbi:MAG: biotin/lipoate A/B protein ligase family protein [Actinomycetota bacterium]
MAGTRRPWRLVDDLDRPRGAAGQMEADRALLEAVVSGGPPVLRLYRWAPPALSLGRFQADQDVDTAACARFGVEVVRRPTGGRALLHGGDLTYAVAMPQPPGAAGAVDAVYCLLAAGLVAGLAGLGVRAAVARHEGPAGAVCMATQQGADLRVGDRKVCGSAQVRQRGVVLQHGSLLIERLPFDETDLVTGSDPAPGARERLRTATVTLAELGAPTDLATVGAAVVAGFRSALEVEFAPPE